MFLIKVQVLTLMLKKQACKCQGPLSPCRGHGQAYEILSDIVGPVLGCMGWKSGSGGLEKSEAAVTIRADSWFMSVLLD